MHYKQAHWATIDTREYTKKKNPQPPASGEPTPEPARVEQAPTPTSLLIADTLQQPKSSPTEAGKVGRDPHAQGQGESSPARAGHAPNRREPHGHGLWLPNRRRPTTTVIPRIFKYEYKYLFTKEHLPLLF